MVEVLKHKKGFIWIVFLLYAIIFMGKLLKSEPKGALSSQIANHYSVSLNFLTNGFNFFKPETYTLNPEFPPKNQPYREKFSVAPSHSRGITSIDFPITHYVTAILFKVLKSDSFIIVRLFSLLVSFIGLFYLYKASYLVTESYKFGLLLMVAILSLPVYTNFASSGLPGVYACTLLFMGFYVYVKYYFEKITKYYLQFIAFLILAALIRLPFMMYLIGLFLGYLLAIALGLKHKDIFYKILITLFSIAIIGSYLAYNRWHLSYYYGSIMEEGMKPLEGFVDVFYTIKNILLHQTWRYATLIHYLFLYILIFSLVKNISYFKKIKQVQYPLIYSTVTSVGVLLYSVIMFKKFEEHTFFCFEICIPLFVFWSILIYKRIDSRFKNPFKNKYVYISTIIVFLGLGKLHYAFGYERMVDNSKSIYEVSRLNFEGSELVFNDLDIPKDAKILFMDRFTNIVFNQYKRKSYLIHRPTYKKIKEILTWDYDYILTQNFTFEEQVLAHYPNFLEETTVFYTNDKYTIYLKK